MKTLYTFAMVLLLLSVPVLAQKSDSKPQPATSKTSADAAASFVPKPSPEIQRLEKWLVGRWQVAEKFEPSDFVPKGGEGRGTETIHAGPGNLSLLANYHSQGPMGAFEGHGIIVWSPQEKAYKLFWVDNMDPAGEVSTGKWEGKDLVFTYNSDVMGKKMTTKEVYSDITPDSFTFYFDMGPQGQPLKRAMTFKYTRAEAPTRAGRGSRDSETSTGTATPPKQ